MTSERVIKEAPVPVRAWDIHPSGHEVQLGLPVSYYGDFVFISLRPLRVILSNGQTVIVRAKS